MLKQGTCIFLQEKRTPLIRVLMTETFLSLRLKQYKMKQNIVAHIYIDSHTNSTQKP